MILSQDLKKLIVQLPDGVEVYAYEGERTGLRLIQGEKIGWIETGEDTTPNPIECDAAQHDIQAFRGNVKLSGVYCHTCGKEMVERVGKDSYNTTAHCIHCNTSVQLQWSKPVKIHPPDRVYFALWK